MKLSILLLGFLLMSQLKAQSDDVEKIDVMPLMEAFKKEFTLKMTPNPSSSNETVQFYAPIEVKTIKIIDLGTGEESNPEFKSLAEKRYSFLAPQSKGTYAVTVTLKDGILMREKLQIGSQ